MPYVRNVSLNSYERRKVFKVRTFAHGLVSQILLQRKFGSDCPGCVAIVEAGNSTLQRCPVCQKPASEVRREHYAATVRRENRGSRRTSNTE